MSIRLVDSGWSNTLTHAIRESHDVVRIVAPFIKEKAVARLLRVAQPKSMQVITRFSLKDFAQGVSDLSALRLLLDSGAKIRGVRNLHAKLYLFGNTRAVVTSANLTLAALDYNHEFGVVAEGEELLGPCHQYFLGLWKQAGHNLTTKLLADWEQTVTNLLAGGARPDHALSLPDFGTEIGLAPDRPSYLTTDEDAPQAFVKFFGSADKRAERSLAVLEEVRSSGSHWACTYPAGKRPRKVRNGASMFLSRLVKDPADILIYGHAIAIKHEPGRDDASQSDLELRSWKSTWPHYVRVHHAEFVADTLASGVSLNELIDTLGTKSFMPTYRNESKGVGNTDPRRAYRQQAAVELTPVASAWLRDRLEAAFHQNGKLSPSQLSQLDWPTVTT